MSGDIIRPNDYIINGSMEIGFDAVSGYDFGFNTLVFAENNLRILFDDTDTLPGYPDNDWQIEINESANGGTNHYAIDDITSATNPFKIMAGAPDNSIYIDAVDKVGIGTDSPTDKLSVNGSIKALGFIGDGSGITGITGATGGIANTEDITIGADTNNSNGIGEIALQTQKITRMIVTNDGKIGIGTSSPSTELEVKGTGKFQNLEVDSMLTLNGISYTLNEDNTSGPDTLDYTKLLNNPDSANWDKNSNNDFDGHFNSLLMWSERNGNLFYDKGKVSIKGTVPTSFGVEMLRINGAILYNGGATDTVSGILFYDPAGNGSFRYYDNNGEMKVIGAGTIIFNNPDPPEGDSVIITNVEWGNRVCLGNGGYPGYNFGENVFVLVNDTLRIFFFDTSGSDSFPSNDWQMVINDLQNGGDNYFAIFDSTHQTTPFKILAGTTDNSLFIAENSNLGIGINNPSEQIEVDGSVSATHFLGNGDELVGLTGASSEIENSGSTTIGADSDTDNSGQIEFQTQRVTKLLVDNNGNVKIGFSEPTSEFDAGDKDAKFNNIAIEENIAINSIKFSLITETNPSGASLDYNVTNKKTIIFDSAIGALTITGFQNGIPGQKITIINRSAADQVSIPSFSSGTQKIINPGFATYTLNQYESASYIYTGSYWYCQELVKAP